jgi:hypothetical protein
LRRVGVGGIRIVGGRSNKGGQDTDPGVVIAGDERFEHVDTCCSSPQPSAARHRISLDNRRYQGDYSGARWYTDKAAIGVFLIRVNGNER